MMFDSIPGEAEVNIDPSTSSCDAFQAWRARISSSVSWPTQCTWQYDARGNCVRMRILRQRGGLAFSSATSSSW